MGGDVTQFVLAAAVIAIAGTVLARRADEIAEITGIGRLVVGSVLLAGVTSLPELTVDITAVRAGLTDIAVGDLLGSCLMNLLILALLDLFQNTRSKPLSRTAAAHALGGLVSVGMLALAGLSLLVARQFPTATLGGTFVGTTLVAFSNSLPELVASIAALRLGALDLAVGNVFGSNAFNMLLLLPLDLVAPGNLLLEASPTHVVSVFAGIIASSTVLIGQLYQAKRRIPLVEPDAWLVIVVILGSLALLHRLS